MLSGVFTIVGPWFGSSKVGTNDQSSTMIQHVLKRRDRLFNPGGIGNFHLVIEGHIKINPYQYLLLLKSMCLII